MTLRPADDRAEFSTVSALIDAALIRSRAGRFDKLAVLHAPVERNSERNPAYHHDQQNAFYGLHLLNVMRLVLGMTLTPFPGDWHRGEGKPNRFELTSPASWLCARTAIYASG